MARNKYRLFLSALLFTGLGCFSYIFFVYAHSGTDKAALISVKAFSAILFISNFVGFSLLYIDNWLQKLFPGMLKDNRRRLLYLPVAALILLGANYLMLAAVRLMMGWSEPFVLQDRGVRILLLVWLAELVVTGQIIVNRFYHHLAILRRHTEELEERSARAQYQALQSQLNPHFLFNSLNALISEIEVSPENAILFTRHLSDVYRYILQCHDRRLITLREELEFTEAYLFLHKVRLGACVEVQKRIPEPCLDKQVPPLTLQLLMENIIKHNVISVSSPMQVDLWVDHAGMLSISNTIRPGKEAARSGKGLQNLSMRYHLLCGRNIVVEHIHDRFTVQIPLLDEKDHCSDY